MEEVKINDFIFIGEVEKLNNIKQFLNQNQSKPEEKTNKNNIRTKNKNQ